MKTGKIAIAIISFKRKELLVQTLKSIEIANLKHKLPIVIVQQVNEEVEVILETIRDFKFELKMIVNGNNLNQEENINKNRILAWQSLFDFLGAEAALVLEDDAILAEDSIDFAVQIFSKYANRPYFRGINFGSLETSDQDLQSSYSKLRYGIHGPASLITRKTFEKSLVRHVVKTNGLISWDGWIEQFLKTGFMITPNQSKFLDLGIYGTHADIKENAHYFNLLRESFLQKNCKTSQKLYQHKQILHSWRSDCKEFNHSATLIYLIRWYFWKIRFLRCANERK